MVSNIETDLYPIKYLMNEKEKLTFKGF